MSKTGETLSMSISPAAHQLATLPGLGLALLIAAVAQFLSAGKTTLDPLVLSMLISIILGSYFGARPSLQPGIVLSRNFFIPLGIILYGTQMDILPLHIYGAGRVLYIVSMVFVSIAAIYGISRLLGISRKTSMLLSAGSSICGASAIMVLSPVIHAEKEDTSVSILSTTVVGLTGVILYPMIQQAMSLSEDTYALLCGTTLYQMGQVKAAASLLGKNALIMALPLKLLRISMLLPVAIAFSLITRQKDRPLYIPWFILLSLLVALITNVSPAVSAYRTMFAPFCAFFFSVALAGIGLTVDIESMINVGSRPLLATVLGWGVLVLLFLLGVGLSR